MSEPAPSIASLLDDLEIDARDGSVVTVGAPSRQAPGWGNVLVLDDVSGPDDLPMAMRADLGVVYKPLDCMSPRNAEQLLSRLRDVHCERVLLLDSGAGLDPDVLRSLGYLEIERSAVEGRCYLFDPDVFNEPREWNNPSDWANPHNFRKYRW